MSNHHTCLVYEAITLYGFLFQENLTSQAQVCTQLLHISTYFHKKIRFVFFPFHSLLIRESQLFSFPTGTKMFQFPVYAFSKNYIFFIYHVSHSEIPRSKLACSSLGLIAACHVLHRNLSQVIRLTAFKV